MINYGGKIREEEPYIGYDDKENPYSINCIGYTKIKSKNIKMHRIRKDYYLIYLINGTGHYIIDKQECIASAGDVILYKPNEEQSYHYYYKDQPEFYWIHFTGVAVEELLLQLRFSKENLYHLGIQTENINIFKNIINEIQLKKYLYEEVSVNYFIELLYNFSRELFYKKHKEKYIKDYDMEETIKKMNTEYHKSNNLDYYANECKLSIYQFSRKFKKATNVSPMKYIEQLRIDKSKELLLDTHLTVAEISDIIGYNDPFYFSKVFNKITGVNPTCFRK